MIPTITDVWVGSSVGKHSWIDFLHCPNTSYPQIYNDYSNKSCDYYSPNAIYGILSLDDAFDVYAYAIAPEHKRAILFTDGCVVDDEGLLPNCSRACSNITTAFQDSVTTSNCLQYPLITAALQANSLSSNSVALVNTVGIIDAHDFITE